MCTIPSEWLFGDDINARINNINAQQKSFKADKTYFRPESTYFLNIIQKTGRSNILGNQYKGYKDKQERKELAEKVSIRKHNECSLIVPNDVLYSDVGKFEEGKLKYYYEHWKKYTSDSIILDIIINEPKLDFNEIPFQHCCNNFPLSKEEMSIIKSEIQKLKSKKVIVNADKKNGITFQVALPEVKEMTVTG